MVVYPYNTSRIFMSPGAVILSAALFEYAYFTPFDPDIIILIILIIAEKNKEHLQTINFSHIVNKCSLLLIDLTSEELIDKLESFLL
jgi:hypothetical protein